MELFPGAARLVRRDATLDGSVPLRAARACDPLLRGNALGWQLRLDAPWAIDRNPGQEESAALADAWRVAEANGWLGAFRPPSWMTARRVHQETRWGKRVRVLVFTGLLVRARGAWLRVADAGNRRSLLFHVQEEWWEPAGELRPLVLVLTHLHSSLRELRGELATLTAVGGVPPPERRDFAADDPRVLAHLEFFDEEYFRTKRGRPTRKYRRLSPVERAPREEPPAAVQVDLGPSPPRWWRVADRPGAPVVGEVTAPFGFRVWYDGHAVIFQALDPGEQERFHRAVWRRFLHGLGSTSIERHRGAVLYFAKALTPHQPGEPYFFMKAPALVSTPPGTSTLVDGLHQPGLSVLRGVVDTDRFHALPVVFRVDHPGREVTVPMGTPLARLVPFVRDLDTRDLLRERLRETEA